MNKPLQFDDDIFLVVLPVLHALLSNPDNPKQLFLRAIHVWTRPRGSDLSLSLEQRVSVVSYIQKCGREDPRFNEEEIRAACLAITERGRHFRPGMWHD